MRPKEKKMAGKNEREVANRLSLTQPALNHAMIKDNRQETP